MLHWDVLQTTMKTEAPGTKCQFISSMVHSITEGGIIFGKAEISCLACIWKTWSHLNFLYFFTIITENSHFLKLN